MLPLADRIAIWGGLAIITLLSWLYLIRMPAMPGMAMSMPGMPGMAMPQTPAWDPTSLAMTFLMWTVMMVAMMIPSASPMITIYARSLRARGAQYALPVAGFVLGYIVAWTVFSAVATIAQAFLRSEALLSDDLRIGPLFGGIVLVATGLYQVSPLKGACLRHCRSPIGFLMSYWRDGALGAATMGLRHGLYCVGCCWLLMVLLFVAGVMNLFWIAVITFFVLIEKAVPGGRIIAAASGVVIIAIGIWMVTVAV